MTDAFIQTRTEDRIFFITLDRAAKRNAINLEMLEQLSSAMHEVDAHPELRAVIVQAAGPIFSAGVDIMALAALRAEAGTQNASRWLRRLAGRMQQLLDNIEATEVPVIAALHGKVMGLGLELALACDLRVAADDVALSIPEARLGLVADVGGTTRLSRIIGPARAKDMLMTCRDVGAEEALQWGLLNRVAPASQLQEAAVSLAQEIARNAPLAVGLAKRIIDQGDGLDKHSQMALERWAQSQLIATEDVGEAMASFFEKRPPEFKGR
ncbi:MAG: enoyl-CoA hydratase/isomerase family protein [Candidatus Hydrogenedentes bacterium]|nr:enoyl-CoA hydratase/isomerase family protein [Candidatus Hydrogenedentota bacterium]